MRPAGNRWSAIPSTTWWRYNQQMPKSDVKVGIHDFLNSKPILHPFRHGLIEQSFELVIDTPANLADRFAAGELDIAMIPSIEYAKNENALIVPGISISSIGPVETVVLYSEKAMQDVDTVAVDPKSRTSVAMLDILLKDRVGRDNVTFLQGGKTPEETLRMADAGLIIGDDAFFIDRDKYLVNDLGDVWYAYAGRPFVHALLCVNGRSDKTKAELAKAVDQILSANRIGKEHIELVVHENINERLDIDTVYNYLTNRIVYDLANEEIDGLVYFLGKAKEYRLCPSSKIRYFI